MAEFKINIGGTKSQRSFNKTLGGDEAKKLVGKKIGDTFKGELIDLPGYEFTITGGSDKAGFPMRKGLHATGRRRILLAKGVGFSGRKYKKKENKKLRVKISGARKKRTLRGEILSEDIVQINCTIATAGPKTLEEIFGPVPEKVAKKE